MMILFAAAAAAFAMSPASAGTTPDPAGAKIQAQTETEAAIIHEKKMEHDAFLAKLDDGTGPSLAAIEAHAGMGGPDEALTGYPPCRPGRGDDRCIQLYERGVTGRDN